MQEKHIADLEGRLRAGPSKYAGMPILCHTCQAVAFFGSGVGLQGMLTASARHGPGRAERVKEPGRPAGGSGKVTEAASPPGTL